MKLKGIAITFVLLITALAAEQNVSRVTEKELKKAVYKLIGDVIELKKQKKASLVVQKKVIYDEDDRFINDFILRNTSSDKRK